MSVERDWKASFERSYAGAPSSVGERVWREVFGDEFPEGVDPFSFITRSELERVAIEVRVGAGQTLADLGCGRGGPGLWVAGRTGARLIGIDISSNAIDAARRRAEAMRFSDRAEFHEGSFEQPGLAASVVDAVMSIDALLFVPDKTAALRALRSVVARAGRLVFTSWDFADQPPARPPQVADHRPILEKAGFDVVAYEETDDWERRARETTTALIDNVKELAEESGGDVTEMRERLEEQRMVASMGRRIFVVAQAR
jgi:cyclopropane fatty-acyl-phospholipid synthase-like methyltransferase